MKGEIGAYPEYKDSGTAWIGNIPKHWELRRIKNLFRERIEKGYPDEALLAATQNHGVIRKQDYESRTVTAQKDLELLKLVEKGDFVISLRSFQGGIELAHCRGIISPAYTVLSPIKETHQQYFRFFFKSSSFIRTLGIFVTGIREGQNIDYTQLGRREIALPPRSEQIAIAKYLAHETAKIDKAIAAKKKIIALLEEEKRAIIQRAVTKGLDPKAKMKDSGVPWIGEIPEGWDIVRNLALFMNRVEQGITGLPVLQVSLHSGITQEENDQFGRKKNLIMDRSKYKVVREGDLAYNTMRMWQGAVGVAPKDGLVSPAYVVLRPRSSVYTQYYELLFRTSFYKGQMNRFSTGIVSDRNRLYWDTFKQMPNIALPEPEQRRIVEGITSEVKPISILCLKIEDEITLLREYRTRLVADVVTGKLDVRKAAEGLPEFDEADLASGGDEGGLESEDEEDLEEDAEA